MKEKTPLSHEVVHFRMLDFENSAEVSKSIEVFLLRNYFFLKNYGTSEGAVCHNVLYRQPLLSPLLEYQERFYVNNYFE